MARQVTAHFDAPASGPPRHRRATAGRLDLALALAKGGRLDEAAGTALEAVTSGYLVPSNYWRAGLILAAVGTRNIPEGRDLADAYRAEIIASPALAPAGGEPPEALA
jgi:hypothetical protein